MRVLAAILGLTLLAGVARAEEDAKAVYDRGSALFALHKFNEAAAQFERAFELRADPAILYNAAQAHRLAGNKQRAVELYQSLLRQYPDSADHVQMQQHIDELEHAIAADKHATDAPPTTMNNAIVAPAPAATVERAERPATHKRRWVWGVVAGGAALVVAGVTVGIVLGTSKTVPPMTSLGAIRGN